MLKLSKTWDYALKATCYIADRKGLIHIHDISKDEDISEALLRRIIADLEKAGIIETIKGRNGWVKLARELHTISVYDILEAAGEELGITNCTKDMYCEKKSDCYTTDVLGNLQRGFTSLLKMNTLDKIIKK